MKKTSGCHVFLLMLLIAIIGVAGCDHDSEGGVDGANVFVDGEGSFGGGAGGGANDAANEPAVCEGAQVSEPAVPAKLQCPASGKVLGVSLESFSFPCDIAGAIDADGLMGERAVRETLENLAPDGMFPVLENLIGAMDEIAFCAAFNFSFEGEGAFKSFVFVGTALKDKDLSKIAEAIDMNTPVPGVLLSSFFAGVPLESEEGTGIYVMGSGSKFAVGSNSDIVNSAVTNAGDGVRVELKALWALSNVSSLKLVSHVSLSQFPSEIAEAAGTLLSKYISIIPSSAGFVMGADMDSMCFEDVVLQDDKEFFRLMATMDRGFFDMIEYGQIAKDIKARLEDDYCKQTLAASCFEETSVTCDGAYVYGNDGMPHNCHWNADDGQCHRMNAICRDPNAGPLPLDQP